MLACYACDVSEWERKRGRERGEKRRHEEQMRDCLCYACLLCLLAMWVRERERGGIEKRRGERKHK